MDEDFDNDFTENEFQEKEKEILAALSSKPADTERLKQLAISPEGLLTDELRRLAWPKLINIDVDNIPPKPGNVLQYSDLYCTGMGANNILIVVNFICDCLYIEDITRVVISYEIYQMTTRVIFCLSYDLTKELIIAFKVDIIIPPAKVV